MAGRTRLLEVGCGGGDLAAALVERGHDVVALDVKLQPGPRPPGVRFIERDFLEHDEGAYDALLFTHSLHHIHELDAAIDRAASLLAPGGLLVVDDFDLAAPDAATAAFLYQRLGEAGDPLELWRRHHQHVPPLHAAAALDTAIRRRFEVTGFATGPYLYAYFDDRAARVLVEEEQALAAGAIVPLAWPAPHARMTTTTRPAAGATMAR